MTLSLNESLTIETVIEEKPLIMPTSSHNIELTSSKSHFDEISDLTAKNITKKYSTSFSIGILCLDKSIRNAIYQIYGFVRVADEIVDSFHGYDKKKLIDEFEEDTYKSIERKISTNPVLNSFQAAVHAYNIDKKLIEAFLYSMRMDLEAKEHDKSSYDTYIYGSAEVVGLMCLYVFVNGNMEEYIRLRPQAMKLGSAFQKINFLRDIKEDSIQLGRIYFPSLNLTKFDDNTKNELIAEIEQEFEIAFEGIKKLPFKARFGVYLAYKYYRTLAAKIKQMPTSVLLKQRASVSNFTKLFLAFKVIFMRKLNIAIR